jgi:hypothetical protein
LASPGEQDVATRQVYPAGDECAQNQRQEHPVFEGDVNGKRKEIKADVPAIEGVKLAIRHLINVPQDRVPIFVFGCGH